MTARTGPSEEVLGQGRFLRLVRRNGWEFTQRTRPVRSVFIGAVTEEGCILVSEEYRIPIGSSVIGCPAGLVGDTDGQEAESIEAAVKRELLEEAGYSARKVTVLTQGPTSPGQTDEVIAIVLAEGLQKTAAGGGIGGESIVIHEVPLGTIDAWLSAKQRQNVLVDPKLYTVLYFVRQGAAGPGPSP